MQPIRTSMVLADRISMLPDEILCCILSLLTLKEAASTSILSRRWRYLWTSFPRLDFGAENFQEMEANAFVKAVNKVLRVYSGRNLQEFTVRFQVQEIPVREIESYHIDCWIAFAIATGVVKLELDLTYCCFGTLKKYSIPLDLFVGTKGMVPYLKQFDCRSSIVTSPLSIHRQLACLTELVLRSVEVTDEVFRIILLRCSSLTHLVLECSDSLIFAKSTLPHIKLKSLEICGCRNLEKLEISVPNLVSFTYYGLKTTFCIKDAQHLVHVDLRHSVLYSDNPYTQHLDMKDFLFGQFSCYISQLERLSLEISAFKEVPVLNGVHLFRNLKRLDLIGNCFCSLALCYNLAVFLLKASPFLRQLLLWLPTEFRTSGEELRKISIPRHSNLKELVLRDFQGRRSNIEFVLYIAEHAIALERIKIIRDHESIKQLQKKGIGAEEDEMARYLRESLPPGVELKFI